MADPLPDHAPGRLNGDGPLAVIDIGSNSVRLVVYERLSRAPMPLFNEKALCGLGRGLSSTGRLDPAAVSSALGSIRRFRALADQMRVKATHVLATAAAREASDGPAFIAEVERLSGARVEVLSGREEARLSAFGVVSGFRRPNGIAGDLGGGSLELIEVRDAEIGAGETFPLGGLRLEETSGKAMKQAEKIIAQALDGSQVLKDGAGRTFYAIGGTWRSLARLHMSQKGYPLHVMHHYAVPAAEAAEFCRLVARHDTESLDSIEAVSKNRRVLLPYGAAVLEQLIRAMKPSEVVMSALGLREGHLYDLLSPEQKAEDPLLVACSELALLRSRSPRHVHELGPWTGEAIRALGLEETEEDARLRIAACLLADTGWRAHPDYRGQQSVDIIAHAVLVGIDHPGRAFLAMAIYYRHQGFSAEQPPRIREIVSPSMIERARALGMALRVAYLISGAMPGVIGRTRLESRGKALTLVLPRDLEPLAGERVLRRLGQFAKIGGLDAAVAIEG
jgi:exopolyphosphatase/guanosine-5'-triphosphate,3'-diphosphate pyrophosphatase